MLLNPTRRAFCATLIALSAATAVRAQPTLSIAPPMRPPQLTVSGAAEIPVRLQSVRIQAEIAGATALTQVEMVFHNPNRRILEGELQFPLLDGQAITGFALDIDGKLREAVPVDKARGQAVFEDITRQRIDPGLLQATQGNNFKLRVYPIPAGKTRTVVIRYAEQLASAGNRRSYRLPLEYADTLPAFDVHLRVQGSASAPVVVARALGEIAFAPVAGGWEASVERRSLQPRGMLELTLPSAASPFAHTQEIGGTTYFHAEVPLRAASMPRPAPRRVAIAWDSSGSGAARDHEKEFALLDALFGWMRNGEVVLTRLRDTAEAPLAFRIADGNWRELRRALASTVYDGATNLGAFTLPEGAEEVLLFSDGLQNFGERRFDAGGKPVHTVSAATRSDPVALRHAATKSGGRHVDLLAEAPAAGAAMITHRSLRVLDIDATGARNIVMDSPWPVNGRVVVSGELTGRNARLRIEAGIPGQRSRIIDLPVSAAAHPGRLAASQWARLKVAELEGDYDLNRAEIRRIGKAFGLVTRETSLIVLDRVEDYVRHEISPPAELRADYDRLHRAAAERRAVDHGSHLERIVKLFETKQAWWNREFPKDAKPAPVAKDIEMRDDASRRASGGPSQRPAPAPAMAPPPASSPARQESAMAKLAEGRATSADSLAGAAPASISIRLQPWRSDAPYAKRMRDADAANAYRVYLDEKPGFATSTAFYLDAADLLIEKQQVELAVRVLSNLAEMDLENRHVLRILGYRLVQAGRPALAIPVFRKVLELSPEEPQSYRDLGLALAADRQLQKAVDTLYEVLLRPWHDRFPEIELITLAELNAIVATAGQPLDTSRIDARLLRNLPLDLRVVLAWDADNTDIDLWVTDPNGEKAFYGNQLTWQGGRMSQDFTGGYGPEEFSLKLAKPGRYKVEAQFYGHRQQIVAGATTLQLSLFTRFGSREQQHKSVTLRLKGQSEVVLVGEFTVE